MELGWDARSDIELVNRISQDHMRRYRIMQAADKIIRENGDHEIIEKWDSLSVPQRMTCAEEAWNRARP
jgi:hypothetical protein